MNALFTNNIIIIRISILAHGILTVLVFGFW
jgi:hypothetical protein